jgi:NAD(P)-dependent dehydrogenase (short-subunit alcohol dehydrogenase family)
MTERIAVVTGATGTLGREIVKALASQDISVLAVSRSGARPETGEAAALAADVSSDSCIGAIRTALPAGELAMAVHAVGLPGSSGVTSLDPGLLATAVDIKAGGLLRLLRAVEDRVVEGSRVVAVGGHLGIEPTEHAPLAGVANAALANLVRQLVGPVGRKRASVHLIAPGPFESDRVETLIAAKAAGQGITIEQARADLLAELPGGRLPRAQDVASVIAMLLSPAASTLHGSTLFLDGGSRHAIF